MRNTLKKGGFVRAGSIQHFRGIKKSNKNRKKLQKKGGSRKTRSNKKGGFIRAGSIQHFRGVKKSLKNKKGGFIRAGSIQHFRGVKKSLKNKKGGFIRAGSIQHFRGIKKRNRAPAQPVDPFMRIMSETAEVDTEI